jgi:nicotinamidase-related amidase
VTTCVCVSTTVRGGVEHNYRMIVVEDAVAELSRDLHKAEVQILGRAFADVMTVNEVVAMLERS